MPSPTNWARNSFAPIPTVLFAVGVAVFYLVPQIVYLIAVARGPIMAGRVDAIPVMVQIVAGLIGYAFVLPFIVPLLPLVAGRSWRELGVRELGPRDVAIALAGTIAMLLAVDLVSAVMTQLTHRHDTEAAIALLKQIKTAPEKWLFISTAVVFAPVVEELIFRAFLFNAFARYLPIWVAAAASGVVFGLPHMNSGAQFLTIALPLACGGIILAAVYSVTRCFWSNVLTHATFNAIPMILYFVFHVTA